MEELRFVKDYKVDDRLRASFFELANEIFGLNFKEWYEKGYWGNQYIPFSYADGNKVVSNVSVNVIDFIIQGKKKKYNALQIGTVMTHPDYRNRGLSTRLMNKVLEEYKDQYDFMYLFANESVLDFYPKFGFTEVDEYQFSMEYTVDKAVAGGIRKLDVAKKEDLDLIFQFVNERIPVSKIFATGNSQSITMYHCVDVFNQDIYYLEQENVIVIFQKMENKIDIFDIIGKREINIEAILTKIADKGLTKICFHYTPDYKGLEFESNLLKREGALFVRANNEHLFPVQVKHPITSEA
jgi:GNAT superfamily N-acetyltransferase